LYPLYYLILSILISTIDEKWSGFNAYVKESPTHLPPTTMITLIGTGHVFNLSAALLATFDEKQPQVIGVELDPQRYQAILLRNTDPASYQNARKNLPLIYRLLAQFQE